VDPMVCPRGAGAREVARAAGGRGGREALLLHSAAMPLLPGQLRGLHRGGQAAVAHAPGPPTVREDHRARREAQKRRRRSAEGQAQVEEGEGLAGIPERLARRLAHCLARRREQRRRHRRRRSQAQAGGIGGGVFLVIVLQLLQRGGGGGSATSPAGVGAVVCNTTGTGCPRQRRGQPPGNTPPQCH